jgi:transcription antitermination factor NusG
MDDEEKQVLKVIKAMKQAEIIKIPALPCKLKFHHGQKVKIVADYYKTYKGYIKESKIIDNKAHYNVSLILKKRDKEYMEVLEKWLPEVYLRSALF